VVVEVVGVVGAVVGVVAGTVVVVGELCVVVVVVVELGTVVVVGGGLWPLVGGGAISGGTFPFCAATSAAALSV